MSFEAYERLIGSVAKGLVTKKYALDQVRKYGGREAECIYEGDIDYLKRGIREAKLKKHQPKTMEEANKLLQKKIKEADKVTFIESEKKISKSSIRYKDTYKSPPRRKVRFSTTVESGYVPIDIEVYLKLPYFCNGCPFINHIKRVTDDGDRCSPLLWCLLKYWDTNSTGMQNRIGLIRPKECIDKYGVGNG